MKCLHSFFSYQGLSVILGSVVGGVVVLGGIAFVTADHAAGDVQLDTNFRDRIVAAQENQRRQQIEAEMDREKVALEQAQEALSIQKKQMQSDIAGAELERDLAVFKLKWFRETIYPLRLAELNYKIERLNRAITKSHSSDNQKDGETQPIRDLDTELDLTRRRLDVLVNYTKQLKEAELEKDAASLAREFERIKLRSASALRQYEQHIDESKAQFIEAKAKLDQLP